MCIKQFTAGATVHTRMKMEPIMDKRQDTETYFCF